MTTMMFMLMDAAQARVLRAATAGQGDVLDPRLIDAGPYAGQYGLPARLKTNADFEDEWPMMAPLTVVDLDIGEAWPPPPDEVV